MDGDLINYDVMSGGSNVKQNNFDADNFYFADGGNDLFFSEARGKGRARRESKRGMRQDKSQQRQDRRNLRTESKAGSRGLRAQAKVGETEANKELAGSLKNTPVVDQTNVTSTTTTPTAGMSKNTMIALGIGAVLLVGVFYVMSKRGKSGK